MSLGRVSENGGKSARERFSEERERPKEREKGDEF